MSVSERDKEVAEKIVEDQRGFFLPIGDTTHLAWAIEKAISTARKEGYRCFECKEIISESNAKNHFKLEKNKEVLKTLKEHADEAIARERERCAKVADNDAGDCGDGPGQCPCCKIIAAKIRKGRDGKIQKEASCD